MSINRTILIGNLTRDAELSYTPSNTAVLKFCLANNEKRKDPSTGEWRDYPNYVDCTMFGKRAEALVKYMTKGKKIGVDSKLRYKEWEKDGYKRSKLELIVDDIELLSPQGEHPVTTPTARNEPSVPANANDYYDNDLPF